MTDQTKIEPALSPEEWARVSRSPNRHMLSSVETVSVNGEQRPLWRVVATKDAAAKGIAVTNDMLDHSDPRKITRQMLGDLRLAAGRLVRAGDHLGVDLAGHADALASYLPPEG